MKQPTAFNARAIYALKMDVHYRIYPRTSDFYFIRIGGQSVLGGVSSGLRAQLGIVGALIGALFQNRAAQSLENKISQLDAKDPAALLQANQGSFIQKSFDITSTSIDPPGIFGGHGEQFGKWVIKLGDGRTETLQFESNDDVAAAIQLLPPVLGAKLSVNVQWDPKTKSYEKRKDVPRR